MNKKGWLRVVEAFFSILLVASALLIIINQGYIGKQDISSRVYDAQLLVLREIELDNGLRSTILQNNISSGPIYWNEFENLGLENVKKKIETEIPDYLTCQAVICEMDKICEMDDYIKKDVYAQAVAISATQDNYDPRQLKIFCWTS